MADIIYDSRQPKGETLMPPYEPVLTRIFREEMERICTPDIGERIWRGYLRKTAEDNEANEPEQEKHPEQD